MEDGLVPSEENYLGAMSQCLNPYCSGLWSRTIVLVFILKLLHSLNPYCNGRWSRTAELKKLDLPQWGLNPYCNGR